ncbi:MAG: hypothetical protein LM564_05180, partial [Desulfurococcaceae archaeon]|nr:hypothetical protein [Desulfurococcaceae archaeon]
SDLNKRVEELTQEVAKLSSRAEVLRKELEEQRGLLNKYIEELGASVKRLLELKEQIRSSSEELRKAYEELRRVRSEASRRRALEVIDRKKREVEEKAKKSRRLSLMEIKMLYSTAEDLIEEEQK